VALYVGIDPGGTIALGWVADEAWLPWEVAEFVDPLDAFQCLEELVATNGRGNVHVAVEDFQSAGALDRYGIATIKQVGAFEALCRHEGIDVTVVAPGVRIKNREWAREVTGWKPGQPEHMSDALAHAKSQQERRRSDASH